MRITTSKQVLSKLVKVGETAKGNIKKLYEVKKNTPHILRLNGSLISPLFIFPDEEKLYLEKLNKKKLIS